jgi:hypothetical protein
VKLQRKQGSAMLREGSGVYDPEELARLGSVFDQAVAALPPSMRTPANLMEIANHPEICSIGEVVRTSLNSLR